MAVFPGSSAEQEQRKRLLVALLTSLLLHLLAGLLLQQAVATAATGQPESAAVLVTLRAAVGRQPPQAADAEPPPLPPNAGPPAVERAPETSEALLATLGERRLAAYVPPYLATILNVPQGSWYFSRAELSVPPQLQDEPLLQLPPDHGGAAPAAGKLLLRIFVGASGAVERVEVASSSLPPAFDEAAVAAFSRVHFRPGEIEGVAVTSETRFEVVFDGSELGRSHSTDRGVGIR